MYARRANMRTKTKKCGVFAALAAVLLLSAALVTSCPESLDLGSLKVPQEKEQTPFVPPPGMGYIRLNIIDPDQARTVMPTLPTVQFYSVTVTGTGGTYNPTGTSSAPSTIVVAPGTYTVTVYAYSSANNTTRVGKGEASGVVVPTGGGGSPANVTLKGISTEGNGTFKYGFTLPGSTDVVDDAVMNVTTWPTNGTVAALTGVDVKTTPADTTGVSLPAGFYYVTVALTKTNHAPYTKLEIVHIYENMETTFSNTFSALRKTLYDVTYNDIDNSGGTHPDAGGPYSHGTKITVDSFFTSNPPTDSQATGKTFGGWYQDAATTKIWDWDEDLIIRDLDLYAKWVAGENLTINVTALAVTATGLVVDTPTINFNQSVLGTAAANVKVILTNASALSATSIAWKINNVAVATANVSTTTVTGDTLTVPFNLDNLGLLAPGGFDITVEATVGGEPYLVTIPVTVTVPTP